LKKLNRRKHWCSENNISNPRTGRERVCFFLPEPPKKSRTYVRGWPD
jgi:hypothetical protein